jgi:CheY-like chemotaxis protein
MLRKVKSLKRNKYVSIKNLLIVDDCEEVVHMVKRFVAPKFDNIWGATSPSEATRILKGQKVSHLLCDLNLGPRDEDRLSGFVYAAEWRKAFPELERIVIFTAEDISDITIPLHIPRYVNDIVSKNSGMDCVVEALLNTERNRWCC